jgi:hypothetical protein
VDIRGLQSCDILLRVYLRVLTPYKQPIPVNSVVLNEGSQPLNLRLSPALLDMVQGGATKPIATAELSVTHAEGRK